MEGGRKGKAESNEEGAGQQHGNRRFATVAARDIGLRDVIRAQKNHGFVLEILSSAQLSRIHAVERTADFNAEEAENAEGRRAEKLERVIKGWMSFVTPNSSPILRVLCVLCALCVKDNRLKCIDTAQNGLRFAGIIPFNDCDGGGPIGHRKRWRRRVGGRSWRSRCKRYGVASMNRAMIRAGAMH
jgi:hypothetical protein